MRLIDADALRLRIGIHGTNKFGILDENIREYIDTQPTVPAEIVCRCKDCVHSQYDVLLGGYWCNGKNHSGLWFCADGKRRESEAGND